MNRRALTLVELLAALVIASLALSVLLGVVGPMADGQRRAQAIAATREMLERARAMAQTSTTTTQRPFGAASVELTLGHDLVARRTGMGSADQGLAEARAELPPSWTALLTGRDGATPQRLVVRFWQGAADDAVIELRSAQGASVRLELLGVSGQVNELAVDSRSEATR